MGSNQHEDPDSTHSDPSRERSGRGHAPQERSARGDSGASEEYGTADAVIHPTDQEAAVGALVREQESSIPDETTLPERPARSTDSSSLEARPGTDPSESAAQTSQLAPSASTPRSAGADPVTRVSHRHRSSTDAPTVIPPKGSSHDRPKRPSGEDAVVVGHNSALRHPIQTLRDILFKDPTQSVRVQKPEDKIDRILTMLRRLGIAMLKSHHATPDVKETLYEIARAYNLPPVRVVALPTLVAVQVEGTDRRAEIGSKEGGNFRLDQAAKVDLIIGKARRGVIEPDDALREIDKIVASKSRFNWLLHMLGQVIMTLAIGLLINPAWPAIPAYLILGLIVAVLQQLGEKVTTLAVAMPVICAAVVTIVASTLLSDLTHEVPVRLIAPALVTFLPGGTLTIAALELTRDEVIAGSSRLIYGASQLMLLAFGVVIGVAVVPAASTSNEVVINTIGPWTPLLGIALLALGYVLARSAPEGSYLWLVLALCVTYGAQRLGMLIVPAEFSGFFGALLVVPVSRFLSKFRTAPPATVTQLVSFWILVPGSLGFISFTEAASGSSQTANTLITAGLSIFSIALGIIVGSGLYRDTRKLTAKSDSSVLPI